MGKAKSDNDKILKYFRLLGGGRLRVTRVQGRDLLPLNPSECSDDVRHREEMLQFSPVYSFKGFIEELNFYATLNFLFGEKNNYYYRHNFAPFYKTLMMMT